MCKKINELNRTSFVDVLRSMLESVDLHPSEEEVKLFNKQRNELVHVGHFYKHKPEDRGILYFSHGNSDYDAGADRDPSSAGYFFMVNFMDRFFLKFFGYSGPYLNRKIRSLNDHHIGNYDDLV